MAGRSVLLVIDEAQNLTLPSLEEIRMLSNLETEKSKLLQIILMGQPDLRDKLERPELEQLRQRITVSYHLEPLDADETAKYINHRLARAAVGAPMVFNDDVTARIHARSGGVPRLINVIADATLVFGYGEEQSEIEGRLVDAVIADLDSTGVLGPRSNANRRASVVPADPAAAAALLQRNAADRMRPKPDTVNAASPVAPRAVSHANSSIVPGSNRTAAETVVDEKLGLDLKEREQHLRQRELDVAARERELMEQRRVLAEQYRLLRAHPPQAGPMGSAWPPARPADATRTIKVDAAAYGAQGTGAAQNTAVRRLSVQAPEPLAPHETYAARHT